MGGACFHTEDAMCPNCEPDYSALAGITSADWSAMIAGDDPTEADMGRTIARQARTIRRLFTAYFLAKAKSMRNGQAAADNCATCLVAGIEDGKREERARIVTALRDLDLISEYGAVPSLLADAIERGEL